MLRGLGERLSRFSGRWVPDPFVIALGLTVVTYGICVAATDSAPLELIGNWGGRLDNGEVLPKEMGLWKLLTFGMQMCLILVTGHALASSRPVRRAIDRNRCRCRRGLGRLDAGHGRGLFLRLGRLGLRRRRRRWRGRRGQHRNHRGRRRFDLHALGRGQRRIGKPQHGNHHHRADCDQQPAA